MPDEGARLVVTLFGYETATPCIHDGKRTLMHKYYPACLSQGGNMGYALDMANYKRFSIRPATAPSFFTSSGSRASAGVMMAVSSAV